MGCCQSKAALTVEDEPTNVMVLKNGGVTKERLPVEIKGGLTKSSRGSSTIRVGALESGVVRSCCSNEERTLSETSQTSVSASMAAAAGEETDRDRPSCEEAGSPKRAMHKLRRAGIDDEDKLEFEDMDSTSEEWDEDTVRMEMGLVPETAIDVTRPILNALKTASVFQGLDDHLLHKVVSLMTREVFVDGEVIIRQGDMPQDTDCMYYVASGEVHLHISGTQSEKPQIIPKPAGWIFGDIALLFTSPRTASIVASGKCILYALNRTDFIDLMKHVPMIRMLRFLRKLPFLRSVSDNRLIAFGREAEMKLYKKDMPMDLQSNKFYIIRKGKMRVGDASISQGSHTLCRGNFFDADESKSYYSISEVELIIVEQSVYQQLGGAELYLQIVEDAVMQILKAIGNIDVGALDVADIVRRNPPISGAKGDVIIEADQPIEHLYIVAKGDVELRMPSDADLQESKIKRHNGAQFFGEKWNRRMLSAVDVVVASDRIQLLKISHKVLSMAGIRKPKPRKSNGPQLSRRIIDALPLTYEGPQIRFSDLKQHRVVGEGEYGAVRFVTHRQSGEQFALKIMHKAGIKDTKTAEHVIMERKMLVRLDGNNFLVGLRGAYQDERSVYLLMDWVPGGELFSRIIDSGGRLPDHHAVFYAANVVLAYSIMHKLNIIYRDLKPENMLIDKNGYLKLADYGFATLSDGSAWTVCGTPDYQAPEIITRQGASKASDFWALGVLIYEMLTGDAPFKSPSNDRWDIHRRILSGRFYVPEHVSQSAADLITRLLQVNPEKRLGFRESDIDKVKRHPWFSSVDWDGMSEQTTTAPFIPKLANATDTSCFDHYDTPKKMDVPVRNNYFSKECPWSCLWSWIEEF